MYDMQDSDWKWMSSDFVRILRGLGYNHADDISQEVCLRIHRFGIQRQPSSKGGLSPLISWAKQSYFQRQGAKTHTRNYMNRPEDTGCLDIELDNIIDDGYNYEFMSQAGKTGKKMRYAEWRGYDVED